MNDYWQQYWNQELTSTHPQIQVGRTKYGQPIPVGQFNREINSLIGIIGIEANETVIDLCCGNGSITEILSKKARKVIAIDYSKPLLDSAPKGLPNVDYLRSDVRKFNFDKFFYDKIIWHFSIQYFTLSESALILQRALTSMKVGGKILITDIPDVTKQFDFFEGDDAVRFYFDKLTSFGCPIGNWYDKNWFLRLGIWLKVSRVEIIQKPEYHFNFKYRFDVFFEK